MGARRPGALVLLVISAAALWVFPRFSFLYTDWLWFSEVGYQGVFLRSLTARASLGAIVFAAAAAFLLANLYVASSALRMREFQIVGPDGPRRVYIDPGRFRPLLYAGAALIALLIGIFASSRWQLGLLYGHAVSFAIPDPVLGHDVGFYIFKLPLLRFIQHLGLFTILLATVLVAAVHFVGGNFGFDAVRGPYVDRNARRHLAILGALLMGLAAFDAWVGIPELVNSTTGIVNGAAYADVHARMPAQRVLIFAAILGAALFLYQFVASRLWPVIAAIGLYGGVFLLGNIYATLIQSFVVAPDEQVRETPFIVHNIAATRSAFARDRVVERELSGEALLTRDDIERNAATLENVPLWNDQPLLDTFGQIQEIRTYYDFVSVDNDRYWIDGKYRQIMLSARELNSASLPSRTWINEHLTFTHGYGLTLGPVNQVTPEGLPVLFIRDLPPVSTVDIEITQPAIYFGELSNNHVFVKTGTQEFDYPKGDDNVFGQYEGRGGVPLGGFARRAMFALRFGSTDTLLSTSLTADSRVMIYRRIADRVRRIAPFLTYDSDPYLAISGGRLVWIQDAYTTSDRYPYSTPVRGGLNYVRNSVKVTIDAYHGTTTFFLLDPQDPLAATFASIFPDLFRPLEEMPEDLRSRLRYPQGIFALQTAMFATYHMTSPAVFYNKEDQWEIPSIEMRNESARMEPYYTIMKLPGESETEYIQMLPYTPRQKDNLAAWIVARSDGENYGELVAFTFPKQTVIFGPRQIAARINQDQLISPQITLWDQQGSEVIQGTLLVIPIEESLIYIRPLYLRAAGGRIPELKRVVVAHQNRIVMEPTLEEALARLFPGDPGDGDIGESPRPRNQADVEANTSRSGADGLATTAQEHYRRALQAQRNGDWALYGEELKRLGEALDRMAGAAESDRAPR